MIHFEQDCFFDNSFLLRKVNVHCISGMFICTSSAKSSIVITIIVMHNYFEMIPSNNFSLKVESMNFVYTTLRIVGGITRCMMFYESTPTIFFSNLFQAFYSFIFLVSMHRNIVWKFIFFPFSSQFVCFGTDDWDGEISTQSIISRRSIATFFFIIRACIIPASNTISVVVSIQ